MLEHEFFIHIPELTSEAAPKPIGEILILPIRQQRDLELLHFILVRQVPSKAMVCLLDSPPCTKTTHSVGSFYNSSIHIFHKFYPLFLKNSQRRLLLLPNYQRGN